MALAMLAASIAVYAAGRWLLLSGVRLRIQPVRRSRPDPRSDLPLEVQHAVRLEVGPRAATHPRSADLLHAEIKPRPSDPNGEALGRSRTTLVPFSRSEKGYALNFSQKRSR
jgi:hypothetical protein